ncbi:hypothetical protein FACS1894110_26640 [Spirochaetia bacterium]|nr:hypothetical protein FACS1894110_26640 [Spirochaetia bacterium]
MKVEQDVSVSAKRRTIAGITLVALFGALTAAGTFISIPLPFSPVPIVLQNLFALLAGLILMLVISLFPIVYANIFLERGRRNMNDDNSP